MFVACLEVAIALVAVFLVALCIDLAQSAYQYLIRRRAISRRRERTRTARRHP